MVITIGNTSAKICISDHATPASAVYAWYLEPSAPPILIDRYPYGPDMQAAHQLGITRGIKQFTMDAVWMFKGLKIVSSTDWLNLKKALGVWDKGNTPLYLSVKNEWDSNTAVIGTYATPATLIQMTGQVQNLVSQILAEVIICNVDFKFINLFGVTS